MKPKPTRIGEGLGFSEWLDESGRPDPALHYSDILCLYDPFPAHG
jgi:hypothetical protein